MKAPERTIFAITLCAIGFYAAAARAELRGEIVAFGETAAEIERPVPWSPGDQSLTPRTSLEGVRFISHASPVEAQLCLKFGVLVRLIGNSSDRYPDHIMVTLTHPRLTRPDLVSSTVDSYATPVSSNLVYSGWSFDQPWELQPGDWTLTFRHEGRVVAAKTFTVSVPSPVTSLCASDRIS